MLVLGELLGFGVTAILTLVRPHIAAIANTRVLAMIAFAVTALIALDVLNDTLDKFYYVPNFRIWLPVAGAFVAAAFFFRTRYDEFTPLLSMALRASAAGVLAVMVFARPEFTNANAEWGYAADYVNNAYFWMLPCAVLALFRPAFVIPVALYLGSTRQLVYPISGFIMSDLDIRYMLDMALFLALGGFALVKLQPLWARVHPWIASVDRQGEIVGAAFGLHLANYFWSGVAKLDIGPTLWYWIAENRTYNQIPHTAESGILPIAQWPWLTEFAYEAFKIGYVPLNAAIALVQVFAILCVLRIDWLKVTSLLFDVLHIGIYLLGGLFFWPWIWNNLTIWWAARSAKSPLTLNTKVACIVAILLGAPALKINEAAYLAWWDVADARQTYFVAVAEDGREAKVPSAFFLSHSYSVSHQHMTPQAEPGHYEHTMLASARDLDRNEASGQCADPASFPVRGEVESPERRQARLEWTQRFLSAHHAKMVEREAALGRNSFYFRSHHHPSNPFLYPEFNALSVNEIVGYRMVMESACYGLENGRVTKRVLARTSEYFDVR